MLSTVLPMSVAVYDKELKIKGTKLEPHFHTYDYVVVNKGL